MAASIKPKLKYNRLHEKRILILLGVAGVLLLGMILVTWLFIHTLQAKNTAPLDNPALISQIQQYPKAYKSANLPQYPGGDITYLDSPDASVETGITVYVSTTDTLAQVGDYFSKSMAKSGWKLDEDNSTSAEGIISQSYLKDNQQYVVTITSDLSSSKTNILLNWAKKAN